MIKPSKHLYRWKAAVLVLWALVFSAGHAQHLIARYGLGAAAYSTPGDGLSFTADAEYQCASVFSTATAFTYVTYFTSDDPSSFRWDNTDVDPQAETPDNYTFRNKTVSVRQFFYFRPLGLWKKSTHHDLGIGVGYGYSNSISLVYTPTDSGMKFVAASYSKRWNLVPSIYYQYHLKKYVLGLRLGWEGDYRTLAGPITYGQFFVGFQW